MSNSQYERVSVFREGAMSEIDTPKLTPRSSYSTGVEKPASKEPTFNYKPLILRSVPLLTLLALTLALVGLLEYAIVQLPHGSLNLKRRDEAVRRTAVEPVNIIGRRDGVSTSASGLGNSSTSSLSTTSYAYTTADSAYVDGASTSIFYSTDQSAYVQPAQTTTTSSSDEFQANAANPTAFVNPYSTSSSSSLEVLLDTAATAFVPVTSTVTRNQLVQTSFQPTLASTATSAYVPPSSPTPPSPSPGPDTDEGEDADANQDDSTFDNQNASIEDDGQGNSVLVTQVLDAKRVFLGNYLAVCIAVIYRLLWVVLYSSFNLIEPFRQLMARGGALAESALFAFYQNQSNLLGPIPALMKRRWSLAAVGTAYLVVNFLPALASESVYVDTKWDCPNPDLSNTNNPCNPRIMGNVTVLRVMQGLLCFAAAVILFTTSLLLFNKTGLPTKPNSIATVASLMRHPRLLADLSEMPVDASAEQMQRFMEGKRYRMGHYTCANGLAGYGIQPWNGYDSDGFVSPFGTFKHQYTPVDGSLPFSDRHSQKLRHFQIKDVLLTVFLLGTFGVVLAYYLVGGKSGFNDFFNSNTFGPRFVLTLAGTVIASIWKSVEQDAVAMAPYNRLFKRPSSPSSTILMTPSSTPFSSTVRMLLNRYFVASAITMLTLAAEGLNVVISGIPYANGQMRIQFLVSTYMSIAILGFMILVTALIFVLKIREPRIPRKPTTLGAVMSYLCSSRILDDFEGMECFDERTRDQRVRSWNKKYEFKETVRRDGKLAWTIDDAFDQPRY